MAAEDLSDVEQAYSRAEENGGVVLRIDREALHTSEVDAEAPQVVGAVDVEGAQDTLLDDR